MNLKKYEPYFIKFCFVLGGGLVILGLMFSIPEISEKPTDIQQNSTTLIPIYFNDDITKNIEGRVLIQFRTQDVYAIQNQIEYTIGVSPNYNDGIQNIPDLKRVIVIFGSYNEDYSNIDTGNVEQFVKEHQDWYDDVVDLKVENGFYYKSNITFHQEHDVVMYALIFRDDSIQPMIIASKPIVTINSPIVKLEIESIKEQQSSNNIMLGLTFIIIALFPLDIGFRLLTKGRC